MNVFCFFCFFLLFYRPILSSVHKCFKLSRISLHRVQTCGCTAPSSGRLEKTDDDSVSRPRPIKAGDYKTWEEMVSFCFTVVL